MGKKKKIEHLFISEKKNISFFLIAYKKTKIQRNCGIRNGCIK